MNLLLILLLFAAFYGAHKSSANSGDGLTKYALVIAIASWLYVVYVCMYKVKAS